MLLTRIRLLRSGVRKAYALSYALNRRTPAAVIKEDSIMKTRYSISLLAAAAALPALSAPARASTMDSRRTSGYNVLAVMNRVETPDLLALHGLCSRWGRDGNHAPLLFEKAGMRRSADVFPVEFSDIKQTHRVLYGPDPFTSLKINPAFLRLALEHELKSKLILLREKFLVMNAADLWMRRAKTK